VRQEASDVPGPEEYFPAGQRMHALPPLEYVPFAQGVHDMEPSVEVCPAGHWIQVPEDVAPTVEEYVFAGQDVQPIEPAVAYFPTPHFVMGLDAQLYPAGQVVEHCVAASAEYCPTGQVLHEVVHTEPGAQKVPGVQSYFIPPVHLDPGGQATGAVPGDAT
jgi:hypothetical protein